MAGKPKEEVWERLVDIVLANRLATKELLPNTVLARHARLVELDDMVERLKGTEELDEQDVWRVGCSK